MSAHVRCDNCEGIDPASCINAAPTPRDDLMERAALLADELHDLGAGTPEYAVPEAIGLGADALRDLLAHVRTLEAERDDLRAVATREVAAHETQVARLAAERDRAQAHLDAWLEVLPAMTPAEFPGWRSGFAPKGEVKRVGSELGRARMELAATLEKVQAVRAYVRQHDETSPTGRAQWGADLLAIVGEE